jgi:hypothetical protein
MTNYKMVERLSRDELDQGRVPQILLWGWLSERHPDWNDEKVIARAEMARPVLMHPGPAVQ